MRLKKSIMQHEQKFLDTSITAGYLLSGLGTLTLLNGLVTGTDENTRVGRQINIKSIQLRGLVASAPTTTGTGLIRTVVVLDSQPNAAAPTITDFLVSDSLTALNNLNNRKRFRTLHSEVLPIGGSATTQPGGTPTVQEISWYHKCDITTEYNAVDGGTISDITKNSIYMLTYQDGTLGVAQFLIQINARIRFTDN